MARIGNIARILDASFTSSDSYEHRTICFLSHISNNSIIRNKHKNNWAKPNVKCYF